MRQQLLSLHRRLPRNHSASLARGAAATVVVDRTSLAIPGQSYSQGLHAPCSLLRQDNNNTYLYMYNMHEKTMDAGCSLEARPASHRLLQPFSPCFLHTPSSPGYASLCSIIPSSLGTSPLPPPPLGMLVLRHHPSSPGYASFYSAASTSFGYASLCSITPLASPVGTLPPAPSPLLL